MVVDLFDRLSQLSTLALAFGRVDSVVGGTIHRSISGGKGFRWPREGDTSAVRMSEGG